MKILPQVGALKVGALDVESKSFVLQTEGGSYGFPADCVLLSQVRFMAECVPPTCFNVCACSFVVCLCSVSGFLSVGSVLCVAIDSVCQCEEATSGASYVAVLDGNPL